MDVHDEPHTWTVWGNETVVRFLEDQCDRYKFIHDQALRHVTRISRRWKQPRSEV